MEEEKAHCGFRLAKFEEALMPDS